MLKIIELFIEICENLLSPNCENEQLLIDFIVFSQYSCMPQNSRPNTRYGFCVKFYKHFDICFFPAIKPNDSKQSKPSQLINLCTFFYKHIKCHCSICNTFKDFKSKLFVIMSSKCILRKWL